MEETFSEASVSEFDVDGDQQDELFDVLSNSRRRFMLVSLQSAEMPVSVEELATQLEAWEAQQAVPDRSGTDRSTIEISLIHNHLPRMAEAGLIRYDDARQSITRADCTDEVRTHLKPLTSDNTEPTRSHQYWLETI